MGETMSLSDKADALEFQQMKKLGELTIYRSAINKLADGEWSEKEEFSLGPLKPSLMGEDPSLPRMPAKPTLIDFFRLRFGPSKQHLLQSAARGVRRFRSGEVQPRARRHVAGAVPNVFLKARENAASES